MITTIVIAALIGAIFLKFNKKKRKRKKEMELLKEESYYTYAFIEDILQTKLEDWDYDDYDGELERTIKGKFDDASIKIRLENDWGYREMSRLIVFYNGERMLEFEYYIEDNKLESLSYKDDIFSEKLNKEQRKMLKKVIKHLRFIKSQYEMNIEEQEKRKEKEETEKKNRRIERKIDELDFLLDNEKFENLYRRKGTTELEVQIHGHYYALTVLLEGKIYAEYIYSKENRQFEKRYYNTNQENYFIVFDREIELIDYLEGVSIFYQTEQLNDSFDLKNSTEKIGNKAEVIQTKLKLLQKEQEMLKDESLHLLAQTLPMDLEKLMAMYEKVKNKEDIEVDMLDSLEMIEKKLEDLETEIETEKVREIRHRKEVIKLR